MVTDKLKINNKTQK